MERKVGVVYGNGAIGSAVAEAFAREGANEVAPGKKIVWLTTDSRVNFVDNEWTGTTIVFDIVEKGGGATVTFTHIGLTPALKCYGGCSGAWEFYVKDSLRQLIVAGEGKADPK